MRVFSEILGTVRNLSQVNRLRQLFPALSPRRTLLLPPPVSLKTPTRLLTPLPPRPRRTQLARPGGPVIQTATQYRNKVTSIELYGQISEALDVKYLSDASPTEKLDVVKGIVYGGRSQLFVSMALKMNQKTKNIHFLLDTGSPLTYLSQEVLKSFDVIVERSDIVLPVEINNKPTEAYLFPATWHNPYVNILGTRYLNSIEAVLNVTFRRNRLSLSLKTTCNKKNKV